MADDENTTQANPGSGDGDGPPRETTSGRYVSRSDDADKTDDDKDKEEPEGKKRWLLLLLLLLLILLLLICAGAAYMRWWNKDVPEPTPSPTVATTTSAPSPSVSASASASPTASPTPVARTVAMPNVVGMQAAQAKTVLESAGLTNIKFVDEAKPNDSLSILASFVVTKQSVAAGTQVPVDTAVTISCATSSNGKG
jgi:hypothetical protein